MKQLTATSAARNFSDLLDKVEKEHESFLVTRQGRAVATIHPANTQTGAALKKALNSHQPDAAWAGELKALRATIKPPDERWPA